MGSALALFTLAHVAISLAAIATGLIVAGGLLSSRRLDQMTAAFLATTAATSVTGFLFPFAGFLPSHAFGILSLLVFPVVVYARYIRKLAGRWRTVYVITAMLVLYLNSFVLVAQLFLRLPALKELAPKQAEPPFAVSQLALLVLFVALAVVAARRFRADPSGPLPTRP
jgi:hypothetical protein